MNQINLVLFGTGNVGSTFIKQLLSTKKSLEVQGLEINLPVIANSRLAFFEKRTLNPSWETDFKNFGFPYRFEDVLRYVEKRNYQNLIAIDATASDTFVYNYPRLVEAGFHLVAANKAANTISSEFYLNLRKLLKKHNRHFYYETNVGAGLPIIQTLQDLYVAGEKINKVRGVFSGSLSYIFNNFSEGDRSFSEIVSEARYKGFTEPDPRVDLSGKDVARKLLILARELKLIKELSEVEVEDLVPKHLNGGTSIEHFLSHQSELDLPLGEKRRALRAGEVLRHVGELDLETERLEVKLSQEPIHSPLGSLREADSSFEIYTESYGERPLVVQGAGAGAAVTARGVLSDLIKLAAKLVPHEDPS